MSCTPVFLKPWQASSTFRQFQVPKIPKSSGSQRGEEGESQGRGRKDPRLNGGWHGWLHREETPWFKWFLNDVPHSNEEFYSCQLCFRYISGKTWDWSSQPRKWAVRPIHAEKWSKTALATATAKLSYFLFGTWVLWWGSNRPIFEISMRCILYVLPPNYHKLV